MRSDPTIRQPATFDTGPMAQLLSAIIRAGGTTAMTAPVSAQDMAAMIGQDADRSAWFVAEVGGEIAGFQHINPYSGLPPEACDIATFVGQGRQQLGVGSALFTATAQAARDLGYDWICACIRTDNAGGRAYYQSRGFRDYQLLENVTLANGQQVNQMLTRFDLD
ncbi:GNAT family N-acetyltransferase [Thalassobius sp. Cn5-15]|uniref:GNAT family N-acetyltransferase n=1 Tax=Thalassobius sp. Cn5-15 TaxID=2917763 RepID=UPI001EF39DB4|nr:GNAT family N-acetyltransferase [Thalassobius sp. Cn5-15]MCG7493912.1 GNAT family N-acetyltransferase [Thalassobius sp. Cn5-15]